MAGGKPSGGRLRCVEKYPDARARVSGRQVATGVRGRAQDYAVCRRCRSFIVEGFVRLDASAAESRMLEPIVSRGSRTRGTDAELSLDEPPHLLEDAAFVLAELPRGRIDQTQ